jgi:membrane-bound lytic murein transglycosylase B
MGRPIDDQNQRMPPMNSARRRALATVLSALAGGGLTAASLGGPLTGLAYGAEAPTGSPVAAEGSTTQASSPSTSAAATPSTPATPSTSTTTTAPTATTPAASTPASTPAVQPQAPVVVLQRKQQATESAPTTVQATPTSTSNTAETPKTTAANNVAGSPQTVAQAGSLASVLANSQASEQALEFYRVPAFLLPIYKAAAVQYGVPWQILAAINEIETDYGNDLSVSSAGAVGWMQFMPSTWLQYGVDALDAGYADPYNPVDAIFAAARYLRAAGAATSLRGAILAYNHSEEYAESVLLRAKLISTYPSGVIATLTGLVDGRLPVTGRDIGWSTLLLEQIAPSSATAGAKALGAGAAKAATDSASVAAAGSAGALGSAAATPGSTPAPSPAAAAAGAGSASSASALAAARVFDSVDLHTSPHANVVAVQDGRIVKVGHSRRLGNFVILRDVYGDVFTYAGLGSIAHSYVLAAAPKQTKSPVVEVATAHDPAPTQAASAGAQAPVTLSVKAPAAKKAHASALSTSAGGVSVPSNAEEEAGDPAKVRLFAHPGNVDARAAAVAQAARRVRSASAGQRQPLRAGAVVTSGTVLGRVRVPVGAQDGHMRFAIQPAGDTATIDPGSILANWAQLETALHPKDAKATDALLGATASDVFLLSKAQLERSVLADPGITINACDRHDVSAGIVDRRVLAVLAFLSRSGLKPTVGSLRCGQSPENTSGGPSALYEGDAVDISAINGISITDHQGPGTITDLTIRTLMTLPEQFQPHAIVSLMRYPGVHNTHASAAYWNRVHVMFAPAVKAAAAATPATVAHSAASGPTAPSPVVTTSVLSPAEWNQLMARVGALQMPHISSKPSSQAILDHPRKSH